jgi:bacterioferritin
MPQFVKDVEQLRDNARRKIENGAVTEAYRGDKEKTISILNEALATEIVCVLRYMHHYFMATGVHGKSVAGEFKEHADAEREHADLIAERIQQLGGKPDFNPRSLLERSVSQYIEGETLADMIREDLIAERIVIEVYTDMIRYFSDNDPTTRLLMERMLKDEEEHASDLVDLLYIVDPSSGETEGQDPGTDPLSKGSAGNGGQQKPSTVRESSLRHGALPGEPLSETYARRSAQSTEQFSGRGSVGAGSPKIGSTEIGSAETGSNINSQERSSPRQGNSSIAGGQTNQAEPRDVEDDARTRARRSARVNKPHRKAG